MWSKWAENCRSPISTRESFRSQLCAQGGPTPQLQRKRFDRAQSRRADVVFHPFHVMIDDLLIKAEELEKIS